MKPKKKGHKSKRTINFSFCVSGYYFEHLKPLYDLNSVKRLDLDVIHKQGAYFNEKSVSL